jgi:type II secretory pathway component PulC
MLRPRPASRASRRSLPAALCALVLLLLPHALPAQTVPAVPPAQPLALRLVGIVVRDGGEALATIEEPRTGRQTFYRVGDTVGEARLVRILEDRAVLVVGGTEVELRLAGIPDTSGPVAPTARAPAPPPEGRGEAVRRARQAARAETHPQVAAPAGNRLSMSREELARLGSSVDLAQYATAEGAEGLRVGDIPPDSLLARLGLLPGDIVRAVDRRPVGPSRSLQEALAAAAGTSRDAVVFEFDRNGQRAVRSLLIKK